MMQESDLILPSIRNGIRSGRQIPRTPTKSMPNGSMATMEASNSSSSPPVPALMKKLDSVNGSPSTSEFKLSPTKSRVKRTPLKLAMAGVTPAQADSPSKAAFKRGFSVFTPSKSNIAPVDHAKQDSRPEPSASLKKVIDALDGVVQLDFNDVDQQEPSSDDSQTAPESPKQEIAVPSDQSTDASMDGEIRRRSSGLNADGTRPLTTGFNKAHQADMGEAELEYINLLKQKTRNAQYKEEIDSLKRKLRTIATQQELAQSAFEKIESEIQFQVTEIKKFMDDVEKVSIPKTEDIFMKRELLLRERSRLRDRIKAGERVLQDLRESSSQMTDLSDLEKEIEEETQVVVFERQALQELQLLVAEKHHLQALRTELIARIESAKAEIAKREIAAPQDENVDIRRLMDRINIYISRHHLNKMAKGGLRRLLK